MVNEQIQPKDGLGTTLTSELEALGTQSSVTHVVFGSPTQSERYHCEGILLR